LQKFVADSLNGDGKSILYTEMEINVKEDNSINYNRNTTILWHMA